MLFLPDQDLKQVYETYKSSDGFLYISYYESASLGWISDLLSPLILYKQFLLLLVSIHSDMLMWWNSRKITNSLVWKTFNENEYMFTITNLVDGVFFNQSNSQ